MATKTTPSIREAVEEYLDTRSDHVGAMTIRNERYLLLRFVNFCPDKQMGRLTREDCEGFLRAMKRGDKKAGSRTPSAASAVAVAAGKLRGLVAWGHRRGWCKGDLMDGYRNPKAQPRRDYLRLSAGELLAMLEQADHPRDRAILAAGMNTALRANELTSLTLGAFDLDNSEFYVVITKTGQTDYMPITADFDAELRTWFRWYQNECGPLHKDWYAFPGKDGNRFLPGEVSVQECGQLRPERRMTAPMRVVHRALTKLGYDDSQVKHEGFHTLRRSVARIYFDRAAEEGYDGALRQTSALLHHSSTRTTEIYLGLDMERSKRDNRMKGRPFLTELVSSNVVPMKKTGGP